jgi:hypothetical protein
MLCSVSDCQYEYCKKGTQNKEFICLPVKIFMKNYDLHIIVIPEILQ